MGETTRVENRGETTRGETTRGETSWGRNVLLPERESGRNDSRADGKVGETTRGRNDSGRKGKWTKRLRCERESGRNDPDSSFVYQVGHDNSFVCLKQKQL